MDMEFFIVFLSHMAQRKGAIIILKNEQLDFHRIIIIFRSFFKYVRPYKGIYFLAMSFLVTGMIMSSFQPYFFGIIIDYVSNQEVQKLIYNIVLMGLTSLLGVVFSFFNKHLMFKVVSSIEMDMSKKLMNNIFNLTLKEFNTTNKGEIISNFQQDIKVLSTLAVSVVSIITGIGSGIVSFVLLVNLNITLALLMLIALPPALILIKVKNKKIHSNEKKVRQEEDIYLSFIQDIVAGFKTIKIFLAENFMNEKFLKLLTKIYDAKKHKALIQNFSAFMLQLLNLIIYIVVVSIGVGQIMSGSLTLGGLVSFNIYSKIFLTSLQNVLTINFQLHEIAVSLERILAKLNIGDANICNELTLNSITIKQQIDFKKDIIFSNMTYMYNESRQTILDNVDFLIPANKVTALVGKSGSGKTTIMNLIMGLIQDYDGTISIGSLDYRHINEQVIFSNISFATQDHFLFPFTIKDNLLLSNPFITENEMVDACRKAYIHDFIITLPEGYNTCVGDKGFNLSGGQIQRISIARALLKKSQIYIFDEMTSSLDNESEEYIKKVIKELAKSHTVVIASHKASTIDGFDHLILLKDRKILTNKIQGGEKIDNQSG